MKRVIILQTDRPVPTYHAMGDVVAVPDKPGQYVARTACGRTESPWRWWSANVRQVHADQFARPCAVCFPEAT